MISGHEKDTIVRCGVNSVRASSVIRLRGIIHWVRFSSNNVLTLGGNMWCIVELSFNHQSFVHGPFETFTEAVDYRLEHHIIGEMVNMTKIVVN
jgi:hypothetical protein